MDGNRPIAKTKSMTKPNLKLYGERNTGTRYLQNLIGRNLDAVLLRGTAPPLVQRLFPGHEWLRDLYFQLTGHRNLGWKHALPPSAERLRQPRFQNTFFVTLTKNPYAFLLSLYRRPYHARRQYATFNKFLAGPWETVRREWSPPQFQNPMDLWNRKNGGYLELARHVPTLHLRYEDLLADPANVVQRIADLCSARSLGSQFENVDESTKEKEKNFSWYRDYYLQERWKDELTTAELDIINPHLDQALMQYFNYAMLT